MHFFLFILLITLFSLPFLPISSAIVYAIGLLLFLIFGQMAIGFVLMLVESIIRGKKNSREDIIVKKDLKYAVWITRIIAFVAVLILSFQYNIFLMIPAAFGIAYWVVVEYIGEKKYKIRLS